MAQDVFSASYGGIRGCLGVPREQCDVSDVSQNHQPGNNEIYGYDAVAREQDMSAEERLAFRQEQTRLSSGLKVLNSVNVFDN